MPAQRQAGQAVGLARRLHAVAIRLLRRARREDVAMGLPPGQASALSVLVFGGPKTLGELADIEQVRPPTMTRMIDALAAAGLVVREREAGDRRRLRLAATSAGVRLMHQGRQRRVAALARMLAGLEREQRITLGAAIDTLEKLGTAPSPPRRSRRPAA
jgi:DNA-binding MarR family transcriptional regulator